MEQELAVCDRSTVVANRSATPIVMIENDFRRVKLAAA